MIDQLTEALEANGLEDARAIATIVAQVLPEMQQQRLSLGQRLTAERGARYSEPRVNWRRIGIKWGATLDLPAPVPPHLVGIMMMDVKTARLVATPDDEDTLDDIEGYVEAQRSLFR